MAFKEEADLEGICALEGDGKLHPWTDRMLEKTREYLDRPAVVGFEGPFLDYLARDFEALGCEVEREDKLVAVSRGPTRGEIFSCHIDRHGLVSTGQGEFQYAAYVARLRDAGEAASPTIRMLRTISDRFLGEPVFAYDLERGDVLARGTISNSYFCNHRVNLVFAVSGLEGFPPGTPVGFARPCQRERDRFSGQLDNGISAALLYVLFEAGFGGRALFTAEEEIGRSWQIALDHLMRKGLSTGELLVMDTSPFPDQEAIDRGTVVLRNRDANGEFNPRLVARLRSLCEASKIPYLMKDEWVEESNAKRQAEGKKPAGLGSTELGRLVAGSGGAVNGATVQLPTFGYHGNRETTSRRAVSHLLSLLGLLVEL